MTEMATISPSLRNPLSLTIQLYHSFYQEAKSTFPSLESGIFVTLILTNRMQWKRCFAKGPTYFHSTLPLRTFLLHCE